MEAFGDFCLKNAQFKDMRGKLDAAMPKAEEAMKAWSGYDGKDAEEGKRRHETMQASQRELTDLTSAIKLYGEGSLRAEYDMKAEAERGMEAGNPLRGATTGSAQKSLLDIINENSAIKSLKDFTDNEGNVLGKNFSSFGWKQGMETIANIPFKSLGGFSALRDPRSAMKAGEITTAVAVPLPQLITSIVPYPLVDSRLLDLVPTEVLTSNTLQFRQQTTLTRNEAPTAENTAPSNTTYNIAATTITAHMIKGKQVFSDEDIMSIPNIIEFGTAEATRDMRRTGANQILQGNNSGQNWNGVYTQADSSTQFILGTTAPLTDNNGDPITIIDAINYSIKILKTTGACLPDMAVCHPNQLTAIRETKDKFGRYLYGDPSQPVADLFIWGIRLIDEIEAISGQMLIGDWAGFYRLSIFQGLRIELGLDSDNFGKWMKTLRYSLYGANRVFRTTAFSVVSNLPS